MFPFLSQMAPRPPSRDINSRGKIRSPRGAVRIVGGQWKRTLLPVIDIPGLRPTPDRVRETAFNWLTHLFGGSLVGQSALDLFAGTGALGLEAASRGADPVVLAERDHAALEALYAIRTRLDARQVHIRSGDAVSVAKQFIDAETYFGIVFLDPPFREGWLARMLPLAAGLCNSTGVLYAESEGPLDASVLTACRLELIRMGKAGDVFYHLLRRNNRAQQ